MPKSRKKTRKEAPAPPVSVAAKPSKKRLRVQSSDEEETAGPIEAPAAPSDPPRPGSSFMVRKGKKEEKGEKEKTKQEVELRKIKAKLLRTNFEKKKLEDKLSVKRNQLKSETDKVNASEVKVSKLKKDLAKLRKANEKVTKEKEEAAKESREENSKLRKKIDAQKLKAANLELEKAKLESKLSSLNICDDPQAGPSQASGSGSGGLFQDMMDNFRELAETQLQCAVCNELFVEATSINCGHTFCHYCINEWRKKKPNCPVCRADIKHLVQCKVLDEYADKVYEQFVSEGGKLARASLKEDRAKVKREAEAAASQRAEARRARIERRNDEDRLQPDLMHEFDRIRRNLEDARGGSDDSVYSDTTLELHLSDGDINTDSEDEEDLHTVRHSFRSMFQEDSDTSDSEDEEYRLGDNVNDTDSLSDSSDSDTSQSSSSESSDSSDMEDF